MSKRSPNSDLIDTFLMGVAAASITSVLLLAPNAIQALEKPLAKLAGRRDKKELRKIAHYLRDKKLVRVTEEDGTYTIELTEKGETRASKARFDQLEIPKSDWDMQWRIFMFDIPEQHKQLRDFVSHHVKRIGFRQLQRSVFVFPYPIDDFIEILLSVHPELKPYIVTLTATHLNQHNSLVKAFHNIL